MGARIKLDFQVDPNGCFIVTSHQPNDQGYCYMYINRKQRKIHRYIYQECFGEISEGLVVRHKCDVRNCINPEHLELGTHTDNMNDSVIRGRKALGERSKQNKITEKIAGEIKILMRDGKRNFEIAKILNISVDIVRKIRDLKTWKHVNISAAAV